MAAAEARAAWQRTANRYFFQEDAKRTPKLACFSSTSSSSSKQSRPANSTTDRNDRFSIPGEKSLYSDLPPDSRWWFPSQPDYIYQKGLTNSFQFVESQDDRTINSLSKYYFEFVNMHSVATEKNGEHPWWQITGKDGVSSSVSNSDKIIAFKEKRIHETESSNRKILEALRHSQTRARVAETAAKEAYAEKEHVMKMVMRQSSELFTCRQWIRVLQLENLYYQIKNNSKINPMSSVSPKGVVSKNGKLQRKVKKASSKRRSRGHEDKLGKYAVVLAMGLGLVGAGLLLGWTVAWMLI